MSQITEYIDAAKLLEEVLACSGCTCCFPCPEDQQDDVRFCYCSHWDSIHERKRCKAWEARGAAAREHVRTFWPDWCYPFEHRRIPEEVVVKGMEYLRFWYPEKKLYSLSHAYKDKEIPTERIIEAFEKGDLYKRAEAYLREHYDMDWGVEGDNHVKFRSTALAWVRAVMQSELEQPTHEENMAAIKDAYKSM